VITVNPTGRDDQIYNEGDVMSSNQFKVTLVNYQGGTESCVISDGMTFGEFKDEHDLNDKFVLVNGERRDDGFALRKDDIISVTKEKTAGAR